MNNNATHRLKEFPSTKRTQLIRVVHDIVIGLRIANEVRWGEEQSHQQHRVFSTEDGARKWLRRIANADQGTLKGVICKRCGCAPQEVMICDETNGGAHELDHRQLAEIEVIEGEPRVKLVN